MAALQSARTSIDFRALDGTLAVRLEPMGLAGIETLGLCTYPAENGFFSFRRATHRGETDYGRQLSAIMLAPDESVYRGGIAC